MSKNSICNCPVCESGNIKESIAINEMPVYCNVLFDDKDVAAEVPKGNIHLGYCRDCGHVFNHAFDESLMDYTAEYENSLHFSPKFNQYANELAQRLVDKYRITGKEVLEIGCGKGDFLKLLCNKGENKGHGFDKSFDPSRDPDSVPDNITFYQDFFDDNYAHLNPDIICCRHVLEHIDQPLGFLKGLRRIIGDRKPIVYFEVPNALYTIKDLGIWDLIYEHCGYFTESSLNKIFTLSGFNVLSIGESFGGQFLYIEASPSVDATQGNAADNVLQLKELSAYVDNFEAQYKLTVDKWLNIIGGLRKADSAAMIWGGGSKGVTFLNVLKPGNTISHVVDVNPHKQGKFVAGTGQEVISPDSVQAQNPVKIIVMNPIYKEEIEATVKKMGVVTEVVCV